MERTRTSATERKPRRMDSDLPTLMVMALRRVFVASLLLGAPLVHADMLPPIQTRGDVQFVSGGIGKDEADAMKDAASQFPLTLEFAASDERPTQDASAPYVSDAVVAIRDAQGRGVLSARSDGPLLLVRLPSGSYTVEAEWNGVRKQRSVSVVNDRRQHVVFDFAGAALPAK
jgi:hypothetical protein